MKQVLEWKEDPVASPVIIISDIMFVRLHQLQWKGHSVLPA